MSETPTPPAAPETVATISFNPRLVSVRAIDDVFGERQHQALRYTEALDDKQDPVWWFDTIETQMNKACADVSDQPQWTAEERAIARRRLVKIAAVAIAGIMSADRQEAGRPA